MTRPVTRDPLAAVRGFLIALAWCVLFWMVAVVAPIAWHNGWRL